MRYVIAIIGIFALVTSVIVCGDPGEEPGARSLLVVVESSLHEPLRASLEQYAETMELARYEVHVESWVSPGTVVELRALLLKHFESNGIEGALLIGELPALMYEMPYDIPGLDAMEEFPTDLYLQDLDAVWVDQTRNDYYDYHDPLELDIYTSRLIGTSEQLEDYFARLELYRREGPLVERSAFIFIDDDWYKKDTSNACNLGELYSEVEVIQDKADSTLENYLAKLTGEGAEFVYQWVHGAPPGTYPGRLVFDHVDDEGKSTQLELFADDIVDQNLKVSFVNLANCYSARFTDDNLAVATAYTVGTEYGLATVGSTKMGAQTDPRLFHEGLAKGLRWGEAYREWYNQVGTKNDLWHLGIVLMGDPLLRVTGDLFPAGPSADTTRGAEP